MASYYVKTAWVFCVIFLFTHSGLGQSTLGSHGVLDAFRCCLVHIRRWQRKSLHSRKVDSYLSQSHRSIVLACYYN